jgi:hypothetical protein
MRPATKHEIKMALGILLLNYVGTALESYEETTGATSSMEIGLRALETADISTANDGQALIVKTEGRTFRIQIGIIRGE